MHYWYGYMGEAIMLGYGRAMHRAVDGASGELLHKDAQEQYVRYRTRYPRILNPVPEETFVAALIAPYAMKTLGTPKIQANSFSSAAEVMRFFAGVKIEHAALNLWNGRVASAYAHMDDEDIFRNIVEGFESGELLTLEKDARQLQTEHFSNALPGVVSHLLARSLAEQTAFASYLRRGTPPLVTTARFVRMAKPRPVPRTWEREAQIERKGGACEHC